MEVESPSPKNVPVVDASIGGTSLPNNVIIFTYIFSVQTA